MKLKDFLPPIAYKINNRLFNRKKVPGVHMPVYSTYSEAITACGDSGYEQEELVEVVFQKTKLFREQFFTQGDILLTNALTQSIMGLLFSLNARKSQEINVLDFGGACGAHYYTIRTALKKKTRLNWHVVETSAMARKAKILETDELRFFDDITTARLAFEADVDYFHSSGTIQYLPNPETILQEIFASQAQYVMLNRLALSSGKQKIVTIQESMLSANGPGALPVDVADRLCTYPVTYFPKHRLEEIIREKYSIVLKFSESVTHVIENQPIITTGYLAERL
jgi:putative methyltransferase (TIGR04325 family)